MCYCKLHDVHQKFHVDMVFPNIDYGCHKGDVNSIKTFRLILSIRVFVFLRDCGFGYILFDFGYWLYSYIVVFVLSILGMVVFSLVCAILLTLRTRNRRGYRHPCIMDSPIGVKLFQEGETISGKPGQH